eukprot:2716447-Amphidinium_carterae.1
MVSAHVYHAPSGTINSTCSGMVQPGKREVQWRFFGLQDTAKKLFCIKVCTHQGRAPIGRRTSKRATTWASSASASYNGDLPSLHGNEAGFDPRQMFAATKVPPPAAHHPALASPIIIA